MFTESDPPGVAEYRNAATQIVFSSTDKRILETQFSEPMRAVTSQRLRDVLGYSGIAASNGAYGRLSKKIADAVGFKTQYDGEDRFHWWRAIAEGDKSQDHFTWVLRDELARALVTLGLLDATTDGMTTMPDIDLHLETYGAKEGATKLVLHLRKERNRVLVEKKKKSARALKCEVCTFDFESTYGVRYCEVHHLVPISSLKENTKVTLNDLAIVCANCHRVVHLSCPPLTIAQARKLLSTCSA
jgi:predicted HNH restriction endonuclease